MNMNSSEQAVVNALNGMGVAFEVLQIDPQFSDTTLFCEKYHYPPERTCNTIIVSARKGEKRSAVCVVLAHTRLDVNKRVKNLLGVAKVSFASAAEMKELTGMEIGGVTPLALPPHLPIYVDSRIASLDWIILGGGGRAIKIKISPQVFERLGAQFITDLAL